MNIKAIINEEVKKILDETPDTLNEIELQLEDLINNTDDSSTSNLPDFGDRLRSISENK